MLRLLEYSNLTKSVCIEPNAPNLINFPPGSNVTFLTNLICRPIKTVESTLGVNLSNIEGRETMNSDFNWTGFNEKVIEIYHYVDSIVHQEDPDNNVGNLNKLLEKFIQSWTKDITVTDAWEVRFVKMRLITSLPWKSLQVQTISHFETNSGLKIVRAYRMFHIETL